ncbi:histidine phosphatase family protein [Pseudomonas sp. NPDC078700]|uniref:histidine phosphatase family protein n=1 Tax=Pseudomonas sp. NPDC078700 TaxID=3364424 RepID=UPI0037C7C755
MTLSTLFKRHSRAIYSLALLGGVALLGAVAFDGRAAPVDGTQTLVFLRHAEKPGEGLGQLNCQGLNRALDLSVLLPEKFGKADYVFAANPSRHVEEGSKGDAYSYIRPLMTISPSAIKLGLPVNIDFGANDTGDLADELQQDKYRNATVYTAWSSGYLPELINTVASDAVGKKQVLINDWDGEDYDSLYVLTLTWHDGKATLLSHNYKQDLNHGQRSCPT